MIVNQVGKNEIQFSSFRSPRLHQITPLSILISKISRIPLDAPALRALERLPSATKPPPTLISPAPQKHFEKADKLMRGGHGWTRKTVT